MMLLEGQEDMANVLRGEEEERTAIVAGGYREDNFVFTDGIFGAVGNGSRLCPLW